MTKRASSKKTLEPVVHPFDRLHGTETSGLIPGAVIAQGTGIEPDDLTAYYGVAPSILEALLDLWLQRLGFAVGIERTVFLDVGAGKGRAMLIASRWPFLRVEGLELSQDLAAIAQRNIEIWQQDPEAEALAPLLLHQVDATRHPLPPEATVAFLFHPFELPILRKFVRHVEHSLTLHPRPFDLVYVNAEHDSYLDHHPAFQRLWTGKVPMSAADHVADLEAIAQQKEYGSTGDELCSFYRYIGRGIAGRSRK